jgi:O-antigen/teichoic acid export membrane protein
MLLAKTIGNAGLNAGTLALNFVIAVLLSRFLGAQGYGAVVYGVAWGTLLAVPVTLGLPPLAIREIAASKVAASPGSVRGFMRRANQGMLAASFVVCGAAAIAFALSGWPPQPLRVPTFIGLALAPLIGIVSLRQGAMQGFGRLVVGRVPETTIGPILVITMIVLLRLTLGQRFSPGWAIGASVAAYVLTWALGAVLLRRATPDDVRGARPIYATRRWALAALPLILMGGVSTANDQVGALVLGALSNARAVGVFSIATRAAALIPFLLLAAIPTLMPSVAELDARGEHEQLQRLMTHGARLVFYFSLPIVVGVVLLAHPLLQLFGASFTSGETALRILALGQIVNIATGFPGMILIMVGESGRVTRSAAIGAIVNLALSLVLIPRFGASGAAAATAASIAITNILLSAVLWRSKKVWSPALNLPR